MGSRCSSRARRRRTPRARATSRRRSWARFGRGWRSSGASCTTYVRGVSWYVCHGTSRISTSGGASCTTYVRGVSWYVCHGMSRRSTSGGASCTTYVRTCVTQRIDRPIDRSIAGGASKPVDSLSSQTNQNSEIRTSFEDPRSRLGARTCVVSRERPSFRGGGGRPSRDESRREGSRDGGGESLVTVDLSE